MGSMISDAKIELRAYGALTVLIQSSNACLEALLSDQPLLAELPDQKKSQLLLLIMLVSLFDAQQFFWEHVIVDKVVAERFERFFYTVFRRILNLNPTQRLKDHRAYIENEGDVGRTTYLGIRVAEEIIGSAEADVATQINTVYAGFLKHFYKTLGQIWEMPDEGLAEGKAALDKITNPKL